MNWFGPEIDRPLVLTRAIHFAASATTAGAVMFRDFVAEPALQTSPARSGMVRARIAALTWTALAIAAVTGLVWLVLLTMGDKEVSLLLATRFVGGARRFSSAS